MTTDSRLDAALAYLKDGYPIIPVGRDKRPLLKWEPFQKELATPDMVRAALELAAQGWRVLRVAAREEEQEARDAAVQP